jgi:hypothetical protein
MRKGKEAGNEGQEGGEELQRRNHAVARAVRGLEREERGWRNAKVKTAVFPLLRFISRERALRSARPARINCRGIFSHRRVGPTTTTAATPPQTGHHHGVEPGRLWQAVTPACPRRPLRARPRRLKRRARDAKP